MNRSTILFFGFFGLFSCFSAQQVLADSQISGTWEGTVYEIDVGYYVVSVQIEPSGRTGRVEYRRYPCGGTLSLIRDEGGRYLYAENLDFGTEICLTGLSARLTITAHNRAYFEELVNGEAAVYGTLERVGGPIGASCLEAGRGLVRDLGTCFERSANQSSCIQEADQKYQNSVALHSTRCQSTCGQILRQCIVNMRPLYDPAGTRGCLDGMQSVTCREGD